MSLRDDLIHIIDNKATPSAYALTVLEFKNLSAKELAFVYFITDHKSPFSVYEWSQRSIEVKNSIFGENNNFKTTPKILAACEKYDKLIETSAVRLLRAARESVIKLEKWGGNYMDVIKEYLNPNFNIKVIKKDTRTTNEKMMTEIRDFMDTANQGFLRRKEEEEKKQEYLKKVYANFLEVKKRHPNCKYNPPDILTCDTNCLNPLCPGELLPDKKYSKMKEQQNEVIEV